MNVVGLLAIVTVVMPLAVTPTLAQHAAPHARTWTVRPEWVRAHESFLASDAMRGRGSATHDEQVAATYVASEFIAYGLRPAPGMTGYVQRAAVAEPQLTGNATLSAGDVTLRQGSDLELLLSSGAPVRGTLRRERSVAGQASLAGTIVLANGAVGNAMQTASMLLRRGASAVLLPESGALDTLAIQMGGKTRLAARLADAPASGGPTLVMLRRDAFAKLASVPDGASATLTVESVPTPSPRATYNAIGYLPGTDPSAGTILLSAHLDHLGVGRAVAGDSIYNGANDDAAGTTAVLELAHALAAGPRPRRSILFVCYGSEEIGELGSTYFGEHPPVPLDSLVANLEFEMIGVQDPRMPKGVLLFTGWDRSNLGPTLRAHGAHIGPDPYPEEHFFERSDNYALALRGVVAHTAAGWGTPPTYHQVNDDLAHLDIGFMTAAIQSLIEPVRWLASSTFMPAWNPGGRPQPRAH
jgi:aminopeptidase YwaD